MDGNIHLLLGVGSWSSYRVDDAMCVFSDLIDKYLGIISDGGDSHIGQVLDFPVQVMSGVHLKVADKRS